MKTPPNAGKGATKLLGFLAALAALALSAPSAWAQGCVLCYTSAAAGGPGAAQAFKWGVLTLLIPALTLFIAVFVLIFRRARAANRLPSALAAPHAVRLAPARRAPVAGRSIPTTVA